MGCKGVNVSSIDIEPSAFLEGLRRAPISYGSWAWNGDVASLGANAPAGSTVLSDFIEEAVPLNCADDNVIGLNVFTDLVAMNPRETKRIAIFIVLRSFFLLSSSL